MTAQNPTKCFRCDQPAVWAAYSSNRNPAKWPACSACLPTLLRLLIDMTRGRIIVEESQA